MTAQPQPLYAIADHWVEVLRKIEDAEGELTPDLIAELDALQEAFPKKAEKVALFVKNLEALAQAAALESARLKTLAQSRENAAERLKKYLMDNLRKLELTNVTTPLAKIRIQRNSVPSVSVSSPSLEVGEEVPVRYQRVSITLDRKQVVDDWKAGTPLPEGIEVTVNSHLRIS